MVLQLAMSKLHVAEPSSRKFLASLAQDANTVIL